MPVFQTSQIIRTDINKCWTFFSDPANLANITPPAMKFVIRFPDPVPEMYQGMIIRYKVSPLFNIPVEWITEISHVAKPYYFVDTQLKGPYKLWHHQHFFEETGDGVKITDNVTYSLPFGFMGSLFAGRLVRKKIQGIFDYRSKVIEKFFNKEVTESQFSLQQKIVFQKVLQPSSSSGYDKRMSPLDNRLH